MSEPARRQTDKGTDKENIFSAKVSVRGSADPRLRLFTISTVFSKLPACAVREYVASRGILSRTSASMSFNDRYSPGQEVVCEYVTRPLLNTDLSASMSLHDRYSPRRPRVCRFSRYTLPDPLLEPVNTPQLVSSRAGKYPAAHLVPSR